MLSPKKPGNNAAPAAKAPASSQKPAAPAAAPKKVITLKPKADADKKEE